LARNEAEESDAADNLEPSKEKGNERIDEVMARSPERGAA
jgi:hypothetical protein